LEKFLHNENLDLPELIKVAIIHYQFETIHPFLDGNGRIGRLLITLFLVEKKLLYKPLLYLSVFFEKDKNLYYDNLTRVRTHNDMLQRIKYFLVGIEETAKKASETLSRIMLLKTETEFFIHKNFGKRIKTGLTLFHHLLSQPLVSIKEVQKVCDLTSKAAGELVSLFEKHNLLNEFTGNHRNRIFSFNKYLNLFND
jgi:Fic family protein